MTIGNVIRKQFMGSDAVQRANQLIEIYKLLKLKGVPNVDTLDGFKPESKPTQVFLSPVGTPTLPGSGSEAFDSVVCVLQALKVSYDASILII